MAAGLFCAVLCLTLPGCAGNHADLTLTSLDGHRDLSWSFANCYATETSNGDWDVVMVHDPATVSSAQAGQALQPAHVEPRQIVHLRVLWNPMAGTPGDQVAAANASVEWFIVGDDDSGDDLVEYAGTAFVSLGQSGQISKVVVRNANLRPIVCRGQMRDRLGPSKLTGTVVATEDGTQVQQVLDEEKRLLQQSDPSNSASVRPVSAAISMHPGALP